jgi:hypothetical protein
MHAPQLALGLGEAELGERDAHLPLSSIVTAASHTPFHVLSSLESL